MHPSGIEAETLTSALDHWHPARQLPRDRAGALFGGWAAPRHIGRSRRSHARLPGFGCAGCQTSMSQSEIQDWALRFRLWRPDSAARSLPLIPGPTFSTWATRRGCRMDRSRELPSSATPSRAPVFWPIRGRIFWSSPAIRQAPWPSMRSRASTRLPVVGVIDTGVNEARACSTTGDILVIATDATVGSHAYRGGERKARHARPREGLSAAGSSGRGRLERATR